MKIVSVGALIDCSKVTSAVREKFGMYLKDYCIRKNISYQSLLSGYMSAKSKKVLESDGFDISSFVKDSQCCA